MRRVDRVGNLAGAPLAGAILSATGRNWHAAITYSGAVQLAGVLTFLYGMPMLIARWCIILTLSHSYSTLQETAQVIHDILMD